MGAGQQSPSEAQRGCEGPSGHLQPRQPPDGKAILYGLRNGLLPPGFRGQNRKEKQQVGLLRENQKRGRFLRFLPDLRGRAKTPSL